jgi:gas vesicle protein
MSLAGFGAGAISGFLVGGTLALLLAPVDGRQMRREVNSRAKTLASQTRGAIADVADKLGNASEPIAHISHSVKELLANGEGSSKDMHKHVG